MCIRDRREYEVARVPVGAALCGQVVDFLGCPHGSQYQLGMDAQLPLLNDQLDMKSREQINSASFTGIKVMLKALSLGTTAACLLCFVVSPSLPSYGRASLVHDPGLLVLFAVGCCMHTWTVQYTSPKVQSRRTGQNSRRECQKHQLKSPQTFSAGVGYRVSRMVHLYRLLIH